jgi:hypothetical protein
MRLNKKNLVASLGSLTGALFIVTSSQTTLADMTLTPAAIARGFTLDSVITGFPPDGSPGVGPLGIGFRNDGRIIVAARPGNVWNFPDVNNQTTANGVIGQSYPTGDAAGITQIAVGNNFRYFLAQQAAGKVIEMDQDGHYIQDIANIPHATSLTPFPDSVPGPYHGHIFASAADGANPGVFDIDPVSHSVRTITTDSVDGMAVSQDGQRIYGAYGSSIHGYNIQSGALEWDSGPIPAADLTDGLALGTGTLSGYIYANMTSGQFWEVKISDMTKTQLASGGSRGDFSYPDPLMFSGGAFPSLLITQSDRILRLDPPGGGWFSPVPLLPQVPEPATLTSAITAIALLFLIRHRNR